MICLWDRLPDDIQHKIKFYKTEAEMKEKIIFWYDLGENIKNIARMNRVYLFEFNRCVHACTYYVFMHACMYV